MRLGKRIFVILVIGGFLVVFGILGLETLHREADKSAHAVAPAFESLANSVHAATRLSKLIKNAVPERQDTEGTQIEVRITPQQKSIKIGERLQVRVEIWNVGSKPVFVERAIYELCGPISPLSFRLDLGPPVKPQTGPGHACAADCIYTAKDSFAARIISRWTLLQPGSFYGKFVTLDPGSFPQLSTPGRWRLSGTYKSWGDLSSSHCFDAAPISDIEAQIKGLGFEAWQGEMDTNSVWIEVASAGNPIGPSK